MTVKYLICLLVICESGNPTVYFIGPQAIYVFTLCLLLLCCYTRTPPIFRLDLVAIAGFVVIIGAHLFTFGEDILISDLGFIVKLLIAVLTVRWIGNFESIYPTLMVTLSWVSLLFYLPTILGVDLVSLTSWLQLPIEGTDIRHIGIHNFHTPEEAHRNSGIFWEPGAFAGYLVLALSVILTHERHLFRQRYAISGLLLALLTTQSTTGYIALMLLICLYVLRYARHTTHNLPRIMLPFVVGLVAWGAYDTFQETSFLGEKIASQWTQMVLCMTSNSSTKDRCSGGAIILSLESPLT
jgi:hypothetical protein